MISNIKDALPQYGTKAADVIYECPVEGGITRMMAIYQDYSGLERIGSVRSCRLYFPKIANEFEAIYVHFGQSDFALPYLDGGKIDNLNGIKSEGSTVFYRTDVRSRHTMHLPVKKESMQESKRKITKQSYLLITQDTIPLQRMAKKWS